MHYAFTCIYELTYYNRKKGRTQMDGIRETIFDGPVFLDNRQHGHNKNSIMDKYYKYSICIHCIVRIQYNTIQEPATGKDKLFVKQFLNYGCRCCCCHLLWLSADVKETFNNKNCKQCSKIYPKPPLFNSKQKKNE